MHACSLQDCIWLWIVRQSTLFPEVASGRFAPRLRRQTHLQSSPSHAVVVLPVLEDAHVNVDFRLSNLGPLPSVAPPSFSPLFSFLRFLLRRWTWHGPVGLRSFALQARSERGLAGVLFGAGARPTGLGVEEGVLDAARCGAGRERSGAACLVRSRRSRKFSSSSSSS